MYCNIHLPLTINLAMVFLPLVIQQYSPASSRHSFLISRVCVGPFFFKMYRPPSSTTLSSFFQVTGTLALETSQDSSKDFPSITAWLASSFSKNTDAAAGKRRKGGNVLQKFNLHLDVEDYEILYNNNFMYKQQQWSKD